MFLLKGEEVWAINRMAGTRVPGFHNPVNLVIPSKIQIEILQTCAGIEPLNATGMNCWAILDHRYGIKTNRSENKNGLLHKNS